MINEWKMFLRKKNRGNSREQFLSLIRFGTLQMTYGLRSVSKQLTILAHLWRCIETFHLRN